jgi:hypothetical protein
METMSGPSPYSVHGPIGPRDQEISCCEKKLRIDRLGPRLVEPICGVFPTKGNEVHDRRCFNSDALSLGDNESTTPIALDRDLCPHLHDGLPIFGRLSRLGIALAPGSSLSQRAWTNFLLSHLSQGTPARLEKDAN